MQDYDLKVYEEVEAWKRRITKRSGIFQRLSKRTQQQINDWVPDKVHAVLTESMKAMVKATLFGSQVTTKQEKFKAVTLAERDETVRRKIAVYQKTAAIEGAGTGAGGILAGLADFPLLLSIKIKLLFEISAIYGFDPADYTERLFILHVFQLAFSSDETRRQTLAVVENWNEEKNVLKDMDWRQFQQEYRDSIDFAKLLQIVPGIGAAVGAIANYQLLKQLGETAMNAYRMRIITTPPPTIF
ncbi:EcsC family protein [Neobacillus sp. SM06]|uniref:EcsC family protein n=1 Tax=Neobacillus sp. SM06 TaxID=3422492 RepID=UPI003D2DD7E1